MGVHKARPLLPQLIRDAEQGMVTELTRGEEERALLVSAATATEAGVPTHNAPAFGIADARPILGDLVAQAAAGAPQVLLRHKRPVAILIPPTATAVATPDMEPAAAATTPQAPATAPTPPSATTPAPAADPMPAAAPPRRRLAPLGQVLDTLLPTAPEGADTGGDAGRVALAGLSTGITALDTALGGLQPGRFYLVAGAPGTGSSLLTVSAARTAALTEHRTVLYAASGLTRADIAARLIAAHTPVDYRRLRAGALADAERTAVARTAELLQGAPLLIDDGAGLDAEAITDTAADVPDLALVVVDRLQTVPDPRLPLSGPHAIADAVQALAHLARTRHLPVLAALDTDNPELIATLAADITLTLTPDTVAGRVHLAIAERDLGPLATLHLTADAAHARLTDSALPAQTQQDTPTPAPNVPAAAAEGPLKPDAPHPGTNPPAPAALPGAAAMDTHSPAHAPGPAPAEQPPAAPRAAAPKPATRPAAAAPRPAARPAPASASRSEYAGTGRDLGYYLDMITSAVEAALEEHGGDTEAASAALEKKAIPNGMTLFEATRVGAAYEHTVYPERLEFLSKKTRNGADEVWEGRHKWENAPLMEAVRRGEPAEVAVDVLDTNAAYCSALKTHLPIGSLVHQPDGGFDPKRSGIYLLPKRPTWDHPHLPDPIGNRLETGPVLLDGATVRLLIRCHKLGLSEAPHITEAWTSGASEGLLEKFRRVLTQARENAITGGDQVTEKYVKAIYAKFASTIGESTYNRDIRRPDWMHIIRSQAFANLWYKAHRAHDHGLTVVRLRGTDELHITGETDWRTVFTEGRLTTQMKLKDQYTLPPSRKRSAQ
ncbi:DnaB-like helicase C-terminal domain-containing protein [Kitasatospora sp. NPDC048365]|uniref:DnaB-like helicase C-terminal domain-containing protein n=1 Tax=Kitasatospora sp. NPDC048365 TaxID=3364050 RepID=UPI0037146A2E